MRKNVKILVVGAPIELVEEGVSANFDVQYGVGDSEVRGLAVSGG